MIDYGFVKVINEPFDDVLDRTKLKLQEEGFGILSSINVNDKFKEKFLEEAKGREDELYNKFFRVYDGVSLGGKMKREINSIYGEELNR